jgi:hypothetical protein
MEEVHLHFRNAISYMDKKTILRYMAQVLSAQDLRFILKYLDTNKKAEILDTKMDAAIAEIFGMIGNVGKKVAEKSDHNLMKLEGRIHLLTISKKIAQAKKNRLLISEMDSQISALYGEYKEAGGKLMF